MVEYLIASPSVVYLLIASALVLTSVVFQWRFASGVAMVFATLSMLVSGAGIAVHIQVVAFILLVGIWVCFYLRWRLVALPRNRTDHLAKLAASAQGMTVSVFEKDNQYLVQARDALWKVRCEHTIAPGDLVEVTGHTGAELKVTPISGVS